MQGQLYKSFDESFKKLSEIFNDILNYHALLKEKQVRGNHAPFMTKELSKAIMEKSKARNKYLKWPSRENYLSHKKLKTNVILRQEKRRAFSGKLRKMR